MLHVGWIGLGAMGFPMAARVADRFDTLVWNRSPEVARRHATEHASRAGPLADVAGADVVISCLSTTSALHEVVLRALPDVRAGAAWVDCTSGDPAASREIAQLLGDHGVAYLDAPVSGMVQGAIAGTLTILVGGDTSTLDHVRPVLDAMGSTIVHVGPVGSGHLVKAANNTLFATALWATSEALGGLATQGVEPGTALVAINASSGRSFASERFLPDCVLAEVPSSPFRLGQTARDVRLLVEATIGDRRESATSLLRELHTRCERLTRSIGPDASARATYAAIQAGVQIEEKP